MDSNLHTLAYFSRTVIGDADADFDTEIAKILAVARANNQNNNVTGALLFSGGCFAQVLEGPLNAVEAVFEHIECDRRHRDVKILHFKPIVDRSFGAWSMGFAGMPERGGKRFDLEGLVQNPADIESGQAGRDVVTILADLIGRHEAAHGLSPS